MVNTRVPLEELGRADVVFTHKGGAAILVSDQVVGLAGSNGLVSNGTRGGTSAGLLGGGALLSGVLLGSLLGRLLARLLDSDLLLGGLLARTLDTVLASHIQVIAVMSRTPVEAVVKADELRDGDLVLMGDSFAAITLLDGIELLASSNGSADGRNRGGSEDEGSGNGGEFHDLKIGMGTVS